MKNPEQIEMCLLKFVYKRIAYCSLAFDGPGIYTS